MSVNHSPTDHARHNELLLAAFAADDDLHGPEREQAASLVASCAACAALVADVRWIRSATAALPAPVRRREFRLSEADARRLRGGQGRGLLGLLAGRRFAFAAPAGTAVATLGLVGLLLGAALPGAPGSLQAVFSGAGADATADRPMTGASADNGSPSGAKGGESALAPTSTEMAPDPLGTAGALVIPGSAAPSEPRDMTTAGSGAGVVIPGVDATEELGGRDGGAGGPDPFVVASLALLVGGLLLVAARLVARRLVAT